MPVIRNFGRVGGRIENGNILDQSGQVVGNVSADIPSGNWIAPCPIAVTSIAAGASVRVEIAPEKDFVFDTIKFASECCPGVTFSDAKHNGDPLLPDSTDGIPLSLMSEVATDNKLMRFEKPIKITKNYPLSFVLTNHNSTAVTIMGCLTGSYNQY